MAGSESARLQMTPVPLPEQLREAEREAIMPTYARAEVAFARGVGSRLFDYAGNEYLDFLAGIAVANTGHCHPRVVGAAREQLGRLMHVSNLFYTEPQVELACALARSSLGGKVFLCNSGAEANEAAIKLARKARAHGEIVVLEGAFHGRTLGALSATPQESKQAPFAPLLPGIAVVAPSADAITAAVSDRTAAVLLEPIQGESGVHVIDDEVLVAARAACDRHGAALIFDEVQCGMGRTGTLWAYQQTPVTPDAITTAKALGGGLPIGALIAGERLADVFAPGEHATTFGGGPVICAAALAALSVIDDQELLEGVRALGELLRAGLAALPGVEAVRGRGLMLGAELAVDAREIVRRALLEQRLVINATGPTTLRLTPPLIIDEADVRSALERIGALLGA
ncbi:MAG TPA: aspartate aminotransferase family protein [Solirubrobacteraceae bacterium]|nr:aspartate aminotransferase family protein [Solirubrobacteraceae bacterium]